jgi:hypothetical protein
MKTTAWLVWTIVGSGFLLAVPVGAADKKPNILVIWGDDIGIHNISAYSLGAMGYKTLYNSGGAMRRT